MLGYKWYLYPKFLKPKGIENRHLTHTFLKHKDFEQHYRLYPEVSETQSF